MPGAAVMALFAAAGALLPGTAQAAPWSTDPSMICGENGAQETPQGVSDGAGGAIIAWVDKRNSSRAIYAQRINARGEKQWAETGVALCNPLTDAFTTPQVISDGAGGAIIGWTDRRNNISGIYAQRISSSGTILWAANGVVVSPNIGVRYTPKLTSDGAGGAILVWRGYKNSEYNIYAQRINSSGTRQWGTSDIPIAVTSGYKEECELTPDGSGGAIMSWYDYRNGNYDIYAQRVSFAGARQWALNGIPVCIAPEDQADPRIASDGAGGAIITWQDIRSDAAYDIYAQRVNGAGAMQWATNGVPVCATGGRQWLPQVVSDGAGGAIIAWQDGRWGSSTNDLYMQRLNSGGLAQWALDGVEISRSITSESFTLAPYLGGAIAGWKRHSFGNDETLVQEVSPQGVSLAAPMGRVISDTSTPLLPALVTDSEGLAVFVWDDSRNGSPDIYASQIKAPPQPAAATGWALYD